MTNRAFDDREHRRGLVLGLTLAEVLLLLLFLLMLALFWRLSEITDDLDDTEAALKQSEIERHDLEVALGELGPLQVEFQSKGLSVESITDLASQLADLAALRKQITTEELKRLVDQAAEMDPSDPPAVLRAGLALAQALGLDPAVLQMVEAATNQATSIDANDPRAALKEVLDFGTTVKKQLIEASLGQLSAEAVAASAIQVAMAPGGPGEHDWPPIISLRDADGYTFQSGSADLSLEFRQLLTGKVVSDLQDIVRRYKVDVVEVIGHTDEQRIAPRLSNLDDQLMGVFLADVEVASLIPADNAGLGMARAAAVAKILLADERLTGLRILPLSGAQMIATGDRLASGGTGDVRERRRIEIRVRRSSEWTPGPADGSG